MIKITGKKTYYYTITMEENYRKIVFGKKKMEGGGYSSRTLRMRAAIFSVV